MELPCFRKCKILKDVVFDYDENPVINTSLNKEKSKIHYYMELFMTEYQQYYIVLEYDLHQEILDRYARIKDTPENQVQLPNDILEVLCNELFGYHNLDFLDKYHSSNHLQYLIKQYILDGKCKFAFEDMYYPSHGINIVNDNCVITSIHNHYSQSGNHGMFYWITQDNLEDTILDNE